MRKLPFTVECRSTYTWFEAIAAFDCLSAAKGYAAECAKTNPEFDYRIKHNSKILELT